jgi:hypothetical protein
MLILLPTNLMLLTALVLLILRLVNQKMKRPWLIAAAGATLALASVFLWQIEFPQDFALPPWRIGTDFAYLPAWLADGVSWPYALALAALATAVIWTSVVRKENDPMLWAGTLVLTAFGILAVSAGNLLTLLLAWSAIDLFELVTMLRSTEGQGQREGVIIAFASRLAGTGLVLWANLVSIASGTPLDFRSTPPIAGIYLLIAASLRLGVLPMHLPYRKDNVILRGFGTSLRLVSAAASLALLARIPASALGSSLTPYLLIMAAFTALYGAWMWLRSSDEILGRPFWMLGLASLAVAESLRGNPVGSTAWGVGLILCGGVLFLYSARQRNILWIPFITFLALSTLPFSLTASAWQAGRSSSWLFLLPFFPAQAMLLAGFFRHALHPGETSLESQDKWVKAIYPAGLLIPMLIALLLGLWGWPGARLTGLWWPALVVIPLSAGLVLLAQKFLVRLPPSRSTSQWTQIFRIDLLYSVIGFIFNFLRRITDIIISAFEGEGGLLWSFLLLVLLLTIFTTSGR